MNTQKQTITIPNELYGDKEVTAYCADGLGTHKIYNRWYVTHVASGMLVGGSRGGDRRTRKGAFDVMAELLKVPVEWSKPYEEIRQQLEANSTAIRLALATSRAS